MSKLSTLSLLSSKDITSNRVGSKFVSGGNRSVSDGANWLNKITSTKLTANKKPGGGKRKRIDTEESENRNILYITKKRRVGS